MEFPTALRAAVEQEAEKEGASRLLSQAQALSRRYREESGRGRRLLTQGAEATAYAAARMPATFGACAAAMQYAAEVLPDFRPHTLLDAGAGTGAAAWAAEAVFHPESILCLEREPAMRELGQRLAQAGPPALQSARWQAADLTAGPLPQAELVTAAYVLNELPPAALQTAAERLWQAARGLLLVVEPGTPAGFAVLRQVRERLTGLGARIAAPCPHSGPCPMTGPDWCHFTCRVARSRLHRQLKGGEAPYEDEKFAYLALCRPALLAGEPGGARVLRHPQVAKGRIALTLCTAQGLEKRLATRRDPAAFRQARGAKCGDRLLPADG